MAACLLLKSGAFATFDRMYPELSKLAFNGSKQFFLIAGPCAIENETITMTTAATINAICKGLGIPFIFKASYRKANRSRADSFTGIGDMAALQVLQNVREQLGVPVTTDIHSAGEAAMAAEYADVLQIPAFLCRQTDLLVAAAKTGRVVNIKKGQFLSPEAMQFSLGKVIEQGNNHVLLTERGTMNGYHDLVVDFRSIPVMQSLKVPVVLDCTHSLQQPNQASGVTGGRPDLIETIARAGIAAGADGLFIETHPDPSTALSDGASMLPLNRLKPLLERLAALKNVVNSFGKD